MDVRLGAHGAKNALWVKIEGHSWVRSKDAALDMLLDPLGGLAVAAALLQGTAPDGLLRAGVHLGFAPAAAVVPPAGQ